MTDENNSWPHIPDHELLREIGKGSYGTVWLARTKAGSFRAIKVVFRHQFDRDGPYLREDGGLKRFEPISREHAGLVAILHYGRNDEEGYFYYVMEVADDVSTGQAIDPVSYTPLTLERRIRDKGRLEISECLKISADLAEALNYMHERGLVHRDIKPSNIIFVKGVPKLADIGLVAEEGAKSFLGTAGYVAPEGPGKAQADIYGLGKVIYEMAMGKDRQAYPSLPTQLDGMPDREALIDLNEIIAQACDPDPRKRYETAEELRAELLVLASGRSLRQFRWRQRLIAGAKLAAVLATATAAISVTLWLWQMHQNRPVIADNFQAPSLNTNIWKKGETSQFSHQNSGLRHTLIELRDGKLLLQARAEHTNGDTCSALAWVDSVTDLRGKGDLVLELDLQGTNFNGRIDVKLSEGGVPAKMEDAKSVPLYTSEGPLQSTLNLQSTRFRAEISGSAGFAIVEAGDQRGLIDLSGLISWHLRFSVRAVSSGGLLPADAQLLVNNVTVRRIPHPSGIICVVKDKLTTRPVNGAEIMVTMPDHSMLPEQSADGIAVIPTPPGIIEVSVRKDRFEKVTQKVKVLPGIRQVVPFTLQRTNYAFGDVVETYPYLNEDCFAIGVNGDFLYRVCSFWSSNAVFKEPLVGGPRKFVAGKVNNLRSLAFCDNNLHVFGAWPGRVFVFVQAEARLEEFKRLREEDGIDWPIGGAFDGHHLWFVENDGFKNRFRLLALNLATGKIERDIPSRDREIAGLAWDGRRLWVSSDSGRVYEVDRELAIDKHSVDAGMGLNFEGHYHSLAYTPGFLWGLDQQTRRICKVKLDHN